MASAVPERSRIEKTLVPAGEYEFVPSHPTRTAPPFTLTISPLIKPANGVQRNKIGPAISRGAATRPSGIVLRTFLLVTGSLNAGADISVATHPGATQFTYIPWPASSLERLLVRLMSAPFVTA